MARRRFRYHFRPPAQSQPLIIAAAPLRVPVGSPTTREWLDSGQWVTVVSSDVAAVSYEADDEILYVEFWSRGRRPNTIYAYLNVPAVTARNLYHCSSIGRFVHRYIKGIYVFIHII